MTVRPDDQVAIPPAWLRMSWGHPHLIIVEGLSSLHRDEGQGFDKLSPNGFRNEIYRG